MGVLSVLRQNTKRFVQTRCFSMSMKNYGDHHPRTMVITPSRWQWHKFKDMLHFYVMVGVIPLGLLTLYANIFIGPSTLKPIPEGYHPGEEEYYRHPITRFITKYLVLPYQELYERKMHVMFAEDEMAQMRLIEKKIKALIHERDDVQGYTFRPIMTKYHKAIREEYESMRHNVGNTK
ncbi:NADH:ubiquinone oxidoreductase NDUFB5/SGDH subunit [Trinorchestia longiramus]|nr:NADH:ubiquinone oxidoreductase NDUFB5/SGDH subunit [Trinorchestia longiramus]